MVHLKKEVTIILPIYNEEKYIVDCIDSLMQQEYPREDMEWLFVDGNSDDNTLSILQKLKKEHPMLVKIFMNKKKTPASAMNIGIQNSVGKYILRFDVHAKYQSNYISKCIYYLNNYPIDNVGGNIETVGTGFWGEIIKDVLSSKFGVGNSKFRTAGKTSYVDTVPFGAFRRDVFEKIGTFDERLPRSEDNEINYRIRKNGGKVLLADDICTTYFCRNSVLGLVRMAYANGKAVATTSYLCKGAMSVRHYIPGIYFFSILSIPLFYFSFFSRMRLIVIIENILYFFLALFFSFCKSSQTNVWKKLLLSLMFFLFHVSYGIGTWAGIILINKVKYRNEGI